MRAQQKIFFTMAFKSGEKHTYTADTKQELVLKVAFLKKKYGVGNIRVVPGSIKKSKVLVVGNTIIAKEG